MIPLTGYSDRLSAAPGERIAFKVSSAAAGPYRARLARVIHADPNPAGPGVKIEDLAHAIRDEFKENEDLPNTTNPDDWARISGKKGERIVYVRTMLGEDGDGRQVERVNAGQYL